MKKKILLCVFSFMMVTLFSCGLIFLPIGENITKQPVDIEQGETFAASGNWDDYANTNGFSVSGTTIRISTATGLAYFSKNIATYANYTVYQDGNIDLSAHYWTPIGYINGDDRVDFTGTYNGQGYGIFGLYNRTDLSVGGFFGYINGATLNGIIIRSGEIRSSDTAGGICAYGDGGFTISNCANYANINSKTVGGILGGMWFALGLNESDYATCQIFDCYNRGNLTSSSSTSWASYVHMGGIAGNVRRIYNSDTNQNGWARIYRCYNTGNISYTGTSTNNVVMGGILGYQSYGSMDLYCCFNLGSVTCSSTVSDQTDINAVVGRVAPSEIDLGGQTVYFAQIGTTYWGVNCTQTYVANNTTGGIRVAQDEDCRQISGFDAAAKLSSTFLSGRYFTINGTQYGWGLLDQNRWTGGDWAMSSSKNDGYLHLEIDKTNLYRIDVNILSPTGAQDYVSGTMTQTYNGQSKYNLNDQEFEYMYQGESQVISNIRPATGLKLSSVTATVGNIQNNNGSYTYTANFSGFPVGNNGWDAVIEIRMEYVDYTVTINPNGGTINGSSSSLTYTQHYNTTLTVPTPETRYGYYFDGWSLSGAGSLSGTTFTFGAGNTTLTAQWIETWAVHSTEPSGSGTASSPYQVDSASDLAYFAYKTQILGEKCYDHIVLTRDIDLSGYDWMPIGTGRNVVPGQQANFFGVFDGQGHSISNLNINVEDEQELNEYGLFGLIDVDAVLKNFTITSGEVNGNERVGGVVGWVWSASVENVTNYANVNGSKSVGGIVGKYHSWEDDFVRECQNYGTITGGNYTGGIVGGGDDSSGTQNIVNCYNFGNVSGSQEIVGGIAGYIRSAKISGCVNYGAVSGSSYHVGGILGIANAGEMQQCHVEGSVKGASHTGGLLGYVYDDGSFSLIDCGVNGEVLTAYVANSNGLIGQGSNLEITNCYFIGEFTDHSGNAQTMSGFVGYGSTNAVTDSYFIANGKKTVQNTTGFEDWTIISGVNGGNPVQKELYHIAGVGGDSEKLDTWLKTNNILSDGSFEYGDWSAWMGTSELSTEHARSGNYSWKLTGESSRWETFNRTVSTYEIDSTHIYFVRMYAYQEVQTGEIQAYWQDVDPAVGNSTLGTAGQWNMYGWRFDRVGFSGSHPFRIDFDNHNQVGELWVDDVLLIDLTAMYGAGNEPSQEECMILFA